MAGNANGREIHLTLGREFALLLTTFGIDQPGMPDLGDAAHCFATGMARIGCLHQFIAAFDSRVGHRQHDLNRDIDVGIRGKRFDCSEQCCIPLQQFGLAKSYHRRTDTGIWVSHFFYDQICIENSESLQRPQRM